MWSPLLFAVGLALAGGIAWIGVVEGRSEAEVNEAMALARQGRHDEATTSFRGLAAEGKVDEARRVRFALALLESGDLSGAEAIQATFSGGKIDAGLAGRWNEAFKAEQAALTAYREGIRALAQGDEGQAWPKLDRALANLGKAKRPHFPATRGEARLHLAAAYLAPPVDPGRLERAEALLAAAADGPAPEAGAVKAAVRSLRGDLAGARAEAAALSGKGLPKDFQLLVLEVRRAAAAGAAERAAVAKEADGIDVTGLDEDDKPRVEALRAP
jgi:thioredoxin-like negative regulator of GroEL